MGGDRLAARVHHSAWRNRATAEQKRKGWEMAVRIEKVLCMVLHETCTRRTSGRSRRQWRPCLRGRRVIMYEESLALGDLRGLAEEDFCYPTTTGRGTGSLIP